MIYTQRHQIADLVGKVSLERLEMMVADCKAGAIARAAENEDTFDEASFNEWLDETVRQKRAEAYRTEADPLFFKVQAGEAEQAEWQAARQAVRDKFPYLTGE